MGTLALLALGLGVPGCLAPPTEARGVKWLDVILTVDDPLFDYLRAKGDLVGTGVDATGEGSNGEMAWFVNATWPIADQAYAAKYGKDLKLRFTGYPARTSFVRSKLQVDFGLTHLEWDTGEKKEWDKRVARDAAYESARIIGVELNWTSHVYTVAWMTQTSQGYYIEE